MTKYVNSRRGRSVVYETEGRGLWFMVHMILRTLNKIR